MHQLWDTNLDVGIPLDKIERRLLIIVGPSGSGKTVIAATIQRLRPDVFFVPIYTTRPRRNDDVHRHYRYVTPDEFFERRLNREFFLCRNSPYPEYGWTRDDLRQAATRDLFSIMLFRHGGARVLLENLLFGCIVSIEPVLERANENSIDRIKVSGEEAIHVVEKNRHLCTLAAEKSWQTKVIKNSFSGEGEVLDHAKSIVAWLASNAEFGT